MATKPNVVSIPLSFYYQGLWQSADWSARVVDDDTGEIVLSAEMPSGDNNGPFAALRLGMSDVAVLRVLAGFNNPPPTPYDCRTTDERLAALDEFAVAVNQNTAKQAIETARIYQRLAALERAMVADQHEFNAKVVAVERNLDRLVEKLAALEAAAADHRLAEDRWQARQDDQLAELTDRLAALGNAQQRIVFTSNRTSPAWLESGGA